MLLLWARNGTWVPLYSGMWQALWKELEELLKRGHLPCCGSASSSRSLHPFKRLLPAGFSVPGKASNLSRISFCQRSFIHPGSSGHQRSTILLGASIASDSLQPCKRLQPSKNLPSSKSLPPSESLPISENVHSSESLDLQELPFPLTASSPERLPPSENLRVSENLQPSENQHLQGVSIPSESLTPESLHPCQRLSETCWPEGSSDPMERSPSSLGAKNIIHTGTFLSADVAR